MISYSLVRRGLAVGNGDESVLQLASDHLQPQPQQRRQFVGLAGRDVDMGQTEDEEFERSQYKRRSQSRNPEHHQACD